MYRLFDEDFPSAEQLPRAFAAEFRQVLKQGQPATVVLMCGRQVGDVLTDNSRVDDGYRFHDVFHFAHAAVLGWSPMSRALFGCKRRSCPNVDEVEDGGRAKILEEAICAIVFAYARARDFLVGQTKLDEELLTTIAGLTSGYEVAIRNANDWQEAILQGYSVWREMRQNGGGYLEADLLRRTVRYRFGDPCQR